MNLQPPRAVAASNERGEIEPVGDASRTWRWPGLWALVAVGLAALVLILATSGYLHSYTESECIVLDETELTMNPSGIVGTTLGPTLRAGIHLEFETGPLFAVQSYDRNFETPWYAISSLVRNSNGDEEGIATWLSPHLLAVWSGGQSGIGLQEWAQSPPSHPEQTYIYAANRLAAEISVWRPAVVRAAAEGASRRCVSAIPTDNS